MRKVILKSQIQASHTDDLLLALEQLVKKTIGLTAGALTVTQLPTKIIHNGKLVSFSLTSVTSLSPSVSSALTAAISHFRTQLGAGAIVRVKQKDLTYFFEVEDTTKSFDSLLEATRSLCNFQSMNTGALEEMTADRLARVKNIEHFEKLIAEAVQSQKALFSYIRQL